MTRSWWLAIAGCALLALAWGVARFWYWEPAGVRRGSLVYALKIPTAAKSFRPWSADSAPVYDVTHGNADAPSYTLIQYASKQQPGLLEPQIVAAGYSCQWFSTATLACARSRHAVLQAQVTAHYDEATKTSQVTVHLY